MSALFLSHSSADDAVAVELKRELAERGHRSVFLDFDPAVGIPAGRQWEPELYARLRACQAVVVLCSRHSMASPWCFAEITHARALGKPLFPVKIDDCQVISLLGDVQGIDLLQPPPGESDADPARTRAIGWQRLIDGLAAAGLDASASFDRDPSRPPYPGLLAFQKEDAAVYFGRGAAIQASLETLQRLRRLGGPRLVLLLGASGSGKSSLVRAGVAPRLERERGQWLPVAPFRPLARPLDSLAVAMASQAGAGDWKALRDALASADDAVRNLGWRDWLGDVRSAGGPEASVLLVVDQLEESLGATDTSSESGEGHDAFLRLLVRMTADAAGPLFVIATLRSDFLGAFQTHPALRGVVYEPIHLPQILPADIPQVIEGPARVAGIALEPGLCAAMLHDTATDDALPLLAFTLREMFDRFGAGDGASRVSTLTIAQYTTELGGLQGALARSAEAVCKALEHVPVELDGLRRALLELVRVDAEGRYVRQPRAWRELPANMHALLERFVQARLLVSRSQDDGERVLEVAHEALFRSWSRLAAWLAADREFLLWRERLRSGSDEWQRNRRDANLLLRGPVLVEAQRWFAERADNLGNDARDFIVASLVRRDAEQAALDQRRRRTTAALASAVLVFGVLAALAGWQWKQASEQRSLAIARQLNVQAAAAAAEDPVRSLLLTVTSLGSAWTVEGHGALLDGLDTLARPQASSWKPHPGAIRAMALSPEPARPQQAIPPPAGPGPRWLATAGPGGLQVQSAAGEVHNLGSRNDHGTLQVLAFAPGGQWLAAACETRVVCVYDTTSWQVATRLPPSDGPLSALVFTADGNSIASTSRNSGDVRLHRLPGGEPLPPIPTQANGIEAMALGPDGRQLAVATRTVVTVWDMASRRLAGGTEHKSGMSAAFSPDGRLLATAGTPWPKVFELSDAGDGDVKLTPRLEGSASFAREFGRVAFGPGGHVAVSDDRDGVQVFDIERRRVVARAPVPAGALVFRPDGRLISGGLDGRILEWDTSDKAARRLAESTGRIRDAGPLHAVALNSDGRVLATATAAVAAAAPATASGVRLWDAVSGQALHTLALTSDANGLAFSADDRWLAAVHGAELWLAEVATGRVVGPFAHEGRVTGVRFEPGGERIATTTAWDASGNARYGIKRPTRIRVWDITRRAELGWRFDIEGDRANASSIAANRSLDAVTTREGGDAALALKSGGWPAAFSTEPLNHSPQLLVPTQAWVSAKTASGSTLAALALQRARRADGVDDDEGHFGFSADGRWLASASGSEARLWPLLATDLASEACVRLPRNLSCAEWRDAMGRAPYARTCAQLPAPPDAGPCDSGSQPGASAAPGRPPSR